MLFILLLSCCCPVVDVVDSVVEIVVDVDYACAAGDIFFSQFQGLES